MKAKTKWGKLFDRATNVFQCPKCRALFVYRLRKRCPECKIGLYAGSEILVDEEGYWWHPERQEWIKISSMRKEVVIAQPGESLKDAEKRARSRRWR